MLCKTCHSLEAAYEQDSDPRVRCGGAARESRDVRDGAEHRRRRQELHRAADHVADDRAAASGEGIQARREGRHGQRGGAPGAGERADRRLLGIHGHVADHVQQDQRPAVARRHVREGQGARCREGTGVAQPVEGEQHVLAGDERRRREEAGHRQHQRPRRQGEGRREAHVREQRRVLRASRRAEAARGEVRLRVRRART